MMNIYLPADVGVSTLDTQLPCYTLAIFLGHCLHVQALHITVNTKFNCAKMWAWAINEP